LLKFSLLILLFLVFIGCSMRMTSYKDEKGNMIYEANYQVKQADYPDGAKMGRNEPHKILDNIKLEQ